MIAANKKLVITGCILGLAVILVFLAIALRGWIANQITDKLSNRLASADIAVESELSPILSGATCYKTLKFQLDEHSKINLENVCVQSGLLSALSDEIDVEINAKKLTANASAKTIADKIATLKKGKKESNGNSSNRKIAAQITIDELDIVLGDKGKSIRWNSEDTQIGYDHGDIHIHSQAVPFVDLEKAPVAIRNIPTIELSADYLKSAKSGQIQITATPSLELGFAYKDKSGVASIAGTELSLQNDELRIKLNQISVQGAESINLASIQMESAEFTTSTDRLSIDDIQKIQLNSPEISLELAQILSQKQIAEHPILGSLIGFWRQEAGAYLGSAPMNSVRREDIIKNKKPVRKNPIPKEKLALIKKTFDDVQQKVKSLPAIDIQNGKITIANGQNHYDFSAISFNTAELFKKDAQAFHLAFNIRDASANFDIRYETETPFPTVSFDIQSMEASDFLRIINMPIPDKNNGQVSLNLMASMSDENFRLKGNITLSEFAFFHEKISPNLVQNVNASATIDAVYSFYDDQFHIKPIALTSGPITAEGFIKISNLRSDPVIEFELGSKDIPCTDIPKAIPDGFLPTITSLRFAGTSLSPKISGKIPWKNPLTATLKESGFENRCIPLAVEPHFPEELNEKNYTFTTDYTYFADAITVGPGTKSYIPLENIPPHVKAAMFLTEDKRFFDHGPLRIAFIERAVRLNLNQRKYVYGGSTIAQQLTKNLFLNRNKNLARKLEEAFIAWRLETVVPRLRIFELYINMIEFGPDIYGIYNASKFYFGKEPKDLTPLEGAFLASLKVAPSKGGRFYKFGFAQNGKWWHKRMRYILKTLAENGYISVPEVIAAYNWTPEFDYPTAPGDYRQRWLNQYGEYLKNKAKQKKDVPDAENESEEP